MQRRLEMIFKVLYQETKSEAPRREHTKAMYVEAASVSEVRQHLSANKPYMVESIAEIDGEHLAYEKEHNPDFEVVKI